MSLRKLKTKRGKPMNRLYCFKFVADNGTIEYFEARNRKNAIEQYCEKHGCPTEFVKQHCLIKNLGNR